MKAKKALEVAIFAAFEVAIFLERYFLLKMWIFQCHVSFQGCNFLVRVIFLEKGWYFKAILVGEVLFDLFVFVCSGGSL